MDDFVRPSPEFSVQAEESKASVEFLEKNRWTGTDSGIFHQYMFDTPYANINEIMKMIIHIISCHIISYHIICICLYHVFFSKPDGGIYHLYIYIYHRISAWQ